MLPVSVRLQVRQQICLCLYSEHVFRGYLVSGYRIESSRHHVCDHGHPDIDRRPAPLPQSGPSHKGVFRQDGAVGGKYLSNYGNLILFSYD